MRYAEIAGFFFDMEYSTFIKKLETDLRELAKPLCSYDKDLNKASLKFIEEYLLYLISCQAAISDRLLGKSGKKDYLKTNGLFTISLLFDYSENPKLTFELNQKATKVYQFEAISKVSESIKAGYVYIIKSEYGYKIGKSRKLENRIKKFGVLLPFTFELVCFIKSMNFSKIEKELHSIFEQDRINGEWFNLSGNCWEILDKYCEAHNYKVSYQKELNN